jgi:hypothetical protein
MNFRRGGIVLATIIAIAGAGYGVWNWTLGMGWERLHDITRDNGYCPEEPCVEQVNTFRDLAADNFSMSADMIQWCLGVTRWEETEVRRGGWLKSALIYVMYLPCGNLLAGEAE